MMCCKSQTIDLPHSSELFHVTVSPILIWRLFVQLVSCPDVHFFSVSIVTQLHFLCGVVSWGHNEKGNTININEECVRQTVVKCQITQKLWESDRSPQVYGRWSFDSWLPTGVPSQEQLCCWGLWLWNLKGVDERLSWEEKSVNRIRKTGGIMLSTQMHPSSLWFIT